MSLTKEQNLKVSKDFDACWPKKKRQQKNGEVRKLYFTYCSGKQIAIKIMIGQQQNKAYNQAW